MEKLEVGKVTTLKSNPEKRVVITKISNYLFFKRYAIKWINDDGSWNEISGLDKRVLNV